MDQLASLRFDMWTDGKRDACAFNVEAPDGAPGLHRTWFVLERVELAEIVSGKRNAAVDGYHKLEVWGDSWMFYDFSIPSADAGEIKVPYRRVDMPRLFVKALLRIARRTWDLQRKHQTDPYNRPRIEWEIPLAARQHACRLYGQGKGSVTWEMRGDKTAAMLGHVKAAAGRDFSEKLEHIGRIAGNSTRGFHQTAKVTLYASDPTGFDWATYAPGGRFIMNGGLINHGYRNGGHDWSVHT